MELVRGCHALGLEPTARQVEQLQQYIDLLQKWNKTMNMISRRDIDRVVSRHILDSLAGLGLVAGPRVLDVGSGAGLPGIPLAIMLTDCQFMLSERMARRARFLNTAVRELGLSHVAVSAEDVRSLESSNAATDQRFTTAVVRAVSQVDEMWLWVDGLLEEQGKLLVYSSTREDSDETAEQIQAPAGTSLTHHQVLVPGLTNRHTITEIKRL